MTSTETASTLKLRRSRLAGRLKNVSPMKAGVLILSVLVIGYLALLPIGFLVWGTFVEDQQFSWSAFQRAYQETGLGVIVWNSMVFAIGASAISVAAGTALAYLVARTDIFFKRLILIASLVPIIVPGLLYTISWVFLGSARIGLISVWLEPVLGPESFDVFSLSGMVLVQGLDNAALAFLLMYAGFKSMDPSLEESAAVSGASLPHVFFRVTLPVNRPALFATVLIMFVRNLESFETPAILGMPNGIFVFTSRIWRSLQFPPDYGAAGALSLSLLVIVSGGVYLYQRMQKQSQRFATISGKGFRPHVMSLDRWRMPATIVSLLYMTIAVALPLFILLYASMQPFFSRFSFAALANSTLSNYHYVFTDGPIVEAFKNSIMLAVGAATLTMLLMAIGAWIVVRAEVRGAWMIDNLAFLPLIVPGLVLGVALIFFYTRIPVAIYGTMWILLIAFSTKNMPYGMRAAVTSMVQIAGELEESAETSGASWWQGFRRVVLPLLLPGLMAGWIYIMITSIRELSTALLVYPPGGEVLAVRLWHMYDRGLFTALSALGVVMIALTSILVIIAQKLGANWGVRDT